VVGGWDDERLSAREIMIRVATAADIAGVLGLWAVARTEHAVTEDRPEAVRRLLETDEESLWVAELDGAIAGAVIAAWDGWRGNFYRLAVEPAHRRSGIGTELVQAGERSLRQRGATRITALVAFDDERAGSFWDQNGYPVDSEIGRRVRNL
jgi:ribosomal protein S18 acetylase RimI-like enzyme